MAALTKARTVDQRAVHNGIRTEVPAAASTTVYGGAFIGRNGSYGRPLVAGDAFLGLCLEGVDNSADSTGGALGIPLQSGMQILHAVTGVTGVADVKKLVYASDDNTLTLTAENNSLVGVIEQHVSSTECWVTLFTQKELALS